MSTRYRRIWLLHSTRAALLAWLLLPAVDSRAQAARLPASSELSSRQAQPAPVHIEDVVHVVGLEDNPGATGNLVFNEKGMDFDVRGLSTVIPLRSILAFSIVHDDRPLMSGTKGKLAQAAPYGVGFAVAMTRPSADTLTLFYRDPYRAIHGCVLMLPKDAGKDVVSALASELSPTDYPKTGDMVPSEPQHAPGIQLAPASRLALPTVEVALPSESVDGIPPAFAAAVFEDMVVQLAQSGLFAQVFRAGDVRRNPDTLVLRVNIESWKKGSARGRGLGPFVGATEIKTSVKLLDASGRTVFQGKVDGAKRMSGESLDAANNFAKHVRQALEKTPALQWSK